MPVYTTCPHCEYPMVVPLLETERGKLCRQCGGGYLVSSRTSRAVALPAHSLAELIRWLRARRLFGGGD